MALRRKGKHRHVPQVPRRVHREPVRRLAKVETETPDTVHGRLLESVHLTGYSAERACGELEWLLDKDRWQRVGDGFTDIDAFLDATNLREFRIIAEQRKRIVKRLAEIHAGQRATSRALGVGLGTVQRDLGADPKRSTAVEKPDNPRRVKGQPDPNGSQPDEWWQTDADPTREAKRLARNAERVDERLAIREARPAAPMPTGAYRLLYADPPWRYEHVVTESRAIENQYPTMSLDEICALEVPAADDAVLFLWATSPKLAEAMQVIDRWGFSYRTCAVWDKDAIGMGYYFRQQHELLLVAARGASVVPPASARPSSVLRARRGRHSEKPEFVYDLLEMMFPTFGENDRFEMFRRRRRPGWSGSGNESEVE
jgi:N6-adenosine-specific RNA methylase IME4